MILGLTAFIITRKKLSFLAIFVSWFVSSYHDSFCFCHGLLFWYLFVFLCLSI